MCHPVTATGSLFLQANRISTVPKAIEVAAHIIHTSPWLKKLLPDSKLPSKNQFPSNSVGTPRQIIPTKPSTKPIHPIGLIASPNRILANKATIKGWESIRTEPKPAPVSINPLAKKI